MNDEQLTIEEALKKIDELTQSADALKKQNEEYLDGWKRAKADYINFKNEQEKRSKELAQFASYALVMQLLPISEHFRKAFGYVTEELRPSEWVKGIEQIYRQLKEVLKGMGIEEMEGSVGKAFDPSLHQAVGNERRDDFDDGVVTQETDGGYTFHGRVVIPSKVIVNKRIEPEAKIQEAKEVQEAETQGE
ncbi:MAG: nucleotide exchange factor GrpE [Patescibacteria group bacterium]